MPIATLFSRSRFRATWWTLFLSIVIIVLLELWRPLVFLTDDNLTAVLPLIMEVGRRLVSGDSPFINEYLFSSYNLQYDPSYLWMWNPLILLLALLANTGAYLWIVDLFCIINLLLCGLFFSCLLVKLREQQSLPLSEAQIILLSLSYTFSGYALVVGASWLIFLANQASLPIVMMGLIHKQARKGIFLVAGGVFYGFMVGHLSPFLFSALFLTVFIIMWSIFGVLSCITHCLAIALACASRILFIFTPGSAFPNADITFCRSSHLVHFLPVWWLYGRYDLRSIRLGTSLHGSCFSLLRGFVSFFSSS